MAAEDPYQTLGVARDADADTIRKAYRKLAKTLHPDLNPGDKAAEERFKNVTAAYDLLSDAEKRARFDRGEIDASGQEQAPRGYYRDHAEGMSGARYRRAGPRGGMGGGPGAEGFQGGFQGGFEDLSDADLGDIFGDYFRARGGGSSGPRRGQDNLYRLEVDFLDAVRGAKRRLTLPDGRDLDVNIPVGLTDGQVLRLRGQGSPGANGGPAGDAMIEVHIRPHRFFRREGNDIHLDLPVTYAEAVLGAKVSVPTPAGAVNMTVPPRSDTGKRLRLRGRGVPEHGGKPAGDLYVTLQLVLGEVDERLEEFLKGWAPAHETDPRAGMGRDTEGGA
ncbi:J domain-containing protein [Roseomonas sp. NAR14]|uniref:J domain-containing protein n=1 Tax=Roseomonas acroporae TaxID=2937791 RepID=A0A9X1YK83_9PROT|nr:J domain-containing protein [Roseomonas acroporae]MCK8787591.1 J domain-containing protein [Roseomonas acroporae]